MNKLNIIAGILILAGVALIGYPLMSKYGLLDAFDTSKPETFANDIQIDEILNKDWEILKSENPADHHVYGALTRLAKLKPTTQTLNLVLNYYDSESETAREGVAFALGFFDQDRVDDKLVEYLDDKSLRVRNQAIKSLGEIKKLSRVMLLSNLYQDSAKLSKKEQVALTATLLKASSDAEIKEKMIDSLVEMAEQGDEFSAEAAQQLAQLAPRSEKTKRMFEGVVQKRTPVGVAQRGIFYLSSIKSGVLAKSLAQLAKDKNDEIRAAAIQGVVQLCPKDRYTILSNAIKREKSLSVASIIAATVLRVFDTKMEQTIEGVQASKLTEPGKVAIEKIMQGISEKKFNNSCSR